MLRDVEWRGDALLISLSFGANVKLKIFQFAKRASASASILDDNV